MIRGLAGAMVLGVCLGTASAADLHVLFLGDDGHHQPAQRAAQLIPIMAGRGIQIRYTEDPHDLNPQTLARYDALLVYANLDTLPDREAKALLDYVAGGGGFVPLHCASFCFRNQPEVVALIGAQFQRHGTGEFDTVDVLPEHPILKDLKPFRTWDETYVHHLHNPRDRTVLQTRPEGNRQEPWTWVRTHGKGRIFYTAYGHDERTWAEPGFQALVERGIRWAANKGPVFDSNLRPNAGLPPLEYVEAEIPNYIPSNKWGEVGEPIRQMQKPLSAAASQRHLVMPHGFHAELFASEPQIGKPLAMTWDQRGRLWLAETVDYPNELQARGKGRDRIRICEDTDGNGRADKFTIFAEHLSIPTSILHAGGGLIVHQAPDTILLIDTDGDDKADVRKPLFTGWGTADTHAGPSNLRYGLDNWLYGTAGYSGFDGAVGGEHHRFNNGLYRFKPDGSKLEFLRSTNNNSWGVGFSEEGLLFGSTANGCPSVYLPIPNRYYERVRGWSSRVLDNSAFGYRLYPITDKVRQVDHFGGFTAAAGHALYTARTYPQQYWNRTAFVCAPTAHLVATFHLNEQGSDFRNYNSWNLLASDDEWTAPIVAEVGPDGNVWVVDWYNYIVQHNPTPEGFQTGKGGAYETPLRDKTRGRIYRIVHEDGAKSSPTLALDTHDVQGLLAALESANMLWRLHAQRLLVERGKTDVVPQLEALVRNSTEDPIGLNAPAIHALWTLDGLGQFRGSAPSLRVAIEALQNPSAGVRRNAVQVLPDLPESLAALASARSLYDTNAQVRLAAFLKVADLTPRESAGEMLLAAMQVPANLQDRWILEAATSAAAVHDRAFLQAILSAGENEKLDSKIIELTARVAEHFARGKPFTQLNPATFAGQLAAPTPVIDAIIIGLEKGWPKGATVELNQTAGQGLMAAFDRASGPAKSKLVSLTRRWGSDLLEKRSAEIAATLQKQIADESQSAQARAAAAEQLIQLRKQDGDIAAAILATLGPRTSPELASGLIRAVKQSESSEVGKHLVESLVVVTPSVRAEVIRALLERSDWIAALLSAAEAGDVQLGELSLDQKQALAAHPDKVIAERAKALLASGGGLPDADRQKVIDELLPVVRKGGDATRGHALFKEQCQKCHQYAGEGNRIGPDLTGMAAHPKEELLVHILDPSRSVEGNFRIYNVMTGDGLVLNGLLVSESKTAIELLDAEAKRHTILREDIEQLVPGTKSLMPEGFEKQVGPQGIADLLAFLSRRGRYLPLDLRKVATADSTHGMFYDHAAEGERLIFDDWGPKTFAGVPFQLVDPQGGRVPNVVLLYGPQGTYPPKMPKHVSLPVGGPAKAIHLLSGVCGWGFPLGTKDSVSMIVRIHYSDGQTEDHPLKNGVHFADYINAAIQVPESQQAFNLHGRQVRYLAVKPQRSDSIAAVELIKGGDATAPIVMAITVEGT